MVGYFGGIGGGFAKGLFFPVSPGGGFAKGLLFPVSLGGGGGLKDARVDVAGSRHYPLDQLGWCSCFRRPMSSPSLICLVIRYIR